MDFSCAIPLSGTVRDRTNAGFESAALDPADVDRKLGAVGPRDPVGASDERLDPNETTDGLVFVRRAALALDNDAV